MFKNRSFKFKLTFALLSFILIQGAALPKVFNIVEDKIVGSYEKKNIVDQEQVFNSYLKTYVSNLDARANNWLSSSAINPLNEDPINKVGFKTNLLGFGNAISSSHAVTKIETYNTEKDLIIGYNTSSDLFAFSKAQPKVNGLIDKTIDDEVGYDMFVTDDEGNLFIALTVTSENEDEDIGFVHVYYLGLNPLLNTFSKINNYPTTFSYNGVQIYPSDYKEQILEMETSTEKIIPIAEKYWMKRTIPFAATTKGNEAIVYSYIDITDIQKSLSSLKKYTNAGFVILCAVFFLSFFLFVSWLVKPLSGIFDDFNSVSNKVNTMSQDLLDSTNQTMVNIDKESASVASTVSAAEEISAMLDRSKTLSNETSKYSNESRVSAEKGLKTMHDMIDHLQSLEDTNKSVLNTVSDGNTKIGNLLQIIEQIAEKTEIINDITFQTKLLSFNASVEAARAGEHGKGFAVVAEEVGNLARMSSEAAQDINLIVEKSLSQVKSTLAEVKTSTESILDEGEHEITRVNTTGKAAAEGLSAIVANFSKVDGRIKELEVAIEEQTNAVQSISSSMREIQVSSDQNRDFSKSNNKAASTLGKESDEIVSSVTELEDLFFGKKAA